MPLLQGSPPFYSFEVLKTGYYVTVLEICKECCFFRELGRGYHFHIIIISYPELYLCHINNARLYTLEV